MKEYLLSASGILYPNLKKLFEGISLSPDPVATRVTELAADVEKQLLATAKNFESLMTKAQMCQAQYNVLCLSGV